MVILETQELTKKFGGLSAVNKVSIKVQEGEIRSIIGPNGSGKSTFFNVINGILFSTSGKVLYKGKDITNLNSHIIAKIGIGRTMQQSELFDSMSVLENVMVGVQLQQEANFINSLFHSQNFYKNERYIKEKALEILDFVELSSESQKLTKNLPYGLQRITEIARALAINPQLLLFDEPVAGMNIQESYSATKLIKNIRAKGVTVILVEHKMRTVMDISDYITVFNFGSVIAEGNPLSIGKNKEVIEAYLGKEI